MQTRRHYDFLSTTEVREMLVILDKERYEDFWEWLDANPKTNEEKRRLRTRANRRAKAARQIKSRLSTIRRGL